MFRTFSLAERVALVFLAFLMFTALLWAFFFVFLLQANRELRFLVGDAFGAAEAFNDLQIAYLRKGSEVPVFMTGKIDTAQHAWHAAEAEFQEALEELRIIRMRSPQVAHVISASNLRRLRESNAHLEEEKELLVGTVLREETLASAESASGLLTETITEQQFFVENLHAAVLVLLVRSETFLTEELSRRVSAVAIPFVAIILFSLGVVYLFLHAVIWRILRAAEATKEIAAGRYGVRVPAGGDDEIGDLARSFNVMSQELARKDRKLRRTLDGLEAAVRDRTANLKESEQRFRILADAATEGIIVHDRGKIMIVNQAFTKMSGYTPEELAGKNAIETLVVPEDRPAVVERIRSGSEQPYAVAVVLKDGRRRTWTVSARPFTMLGKTVRIAALRDVTIEKENERKIAELNTVRNKFIGIVSHQLRTPLTAIRWNLEALMTDQFGVLKPAQKDFIRVTHDANVEVIRRIHDLLTAMDIEEGRVVLETQRASLESVWHSVRAELVKRCAVKQITFRDTPSAAPLPDLEIDPALIREVFEKLADNAVSYTQEKGRISTSFIRTDGIVRFEIRDTGIGIPKAEQSRMFSRFYRASNAPTMKPDASGLGLSIAKHFVEQHNGRIGFSSEEGAGSTFWFELPAVEM